jgi:hypothetical protein
MENIIIYININYYILYYKYKYILYKNMIGEGVFFEALSEAKSGNETRSP